MAADELDFSAEVAADRADILRAAARQIDSLSAHLGQSDAAEPDKDDFGALIRGMAEDKVEFGGHPDVYPVPILDLPDADRASAAWQAARERGFTFWWVRIPLLLFPRRNWAFTRLEVRVEFNANEPDPARRPTAFDILPNRRFDTVMRVGVEFNVGVGADARFSVGTGDIEGLPIAANADATAGAKVNLGITPVRYRMVAARINHTMEGLEKVFWRLDGSEFFQENPPQLIVILQVPKGANGIDIRAVMRAYRRFNLFPVGLRDLIRELPEGLRTFFQNGAPIDAVTRYDLGAMSLS